VKQFSVTTMRPTDPVNDALRLLREEQPAALMSETDITRLVSSAPSTSISDEVSGSSPSHWPWYVGGAVVTAGVVTALLVWPTGDVPTPMSPDTTQQIDVTPTPSAQQRLALPTDEAQTTTNDEQQITPFRPTPTLTLSADELSALGLTFTGDALRYVEDGMSITVRTNGIRAHGQHTPSAHRTPRHITLYRKGQNLARWIDATASDVDVNTLIGVHVRLQDSTLPMFREADVILWYAPTDTVSSSLPRSKVNELQRSSSSQHHTPSSSITSVVIAPNPVRSASATVVLEVQRPCMASIRVIDMMGREVSVPLNDSYSLNTGRETIPLQALSDLPSGMYHVVIDVPSTQERLVQRMLIER
jgi:hypothetical protein